MGCQLPHYIYKNIDCDGDGILDHACFSAVKSNKWLVLSSEGCPKSWGNGNRLPSDCVTKFQGMYIQVR